MGDALAARAVAARGAPRRRDRRRAHAAALKALIDKGGENAKQMPIYQYLVGYNAFHLGDYDEAIAALQKADQRDPFILGLLAQALREEGRRGGREGVLDEGAGARTATACRTRSSASGRARRSK